MQNHTYRAHSYRFSDRAALLSLLALPFVAVIVAGLSAMLSARFGSTTDGSASFYLAAIGISIVSIGLMWLPSYLIGCAVHWLLTRSEPIEIVLSRLWMVPLIAASCAWFPSVQQLPAGANTLVAYLIAAGLVLTVSYIWIVIARLIMRRWRLG